MLSTVNSEALVLARQNPSPSPPRSGEGRSVLINCIRLIATKDSDIAQHGRPSPLRGGAGEGLFWDPTNLVQSHRPRHNETMHTTAQLAWGPPVPETSQANANPAADETTAPLYADVVFDRPMDHPFTYAVPELL